MASIFDNGLGYGPVGRPGSYSFETVTLPSGATYVWKPFEKRWDLTNQSALTGDDGISKISTINNYVIRISSNVSGATIYTNGQKTTNTAPKTLNIVKASFVSGDVRYELKRDGYTSNTYYIIRMVGTQGLTPNPYFLQVRDSILGLGQTKLRVEKYVNGNLQQSYDASKSFVDLRFELTKSNDGRILDRPDIIRPTDPIIPNPDLNLKRTTALTINVTGNAGGNGVVIRTNKGEELEVGSGKNSFVRRIGELFSIQSENPAIYRIAEIEINDNNRFTGKSRGQVIKGNNVESAKAKFTLDKATTINIRVDRSVRVTPRPLPPPVPEEIIGSPPPAPQPVIRLTPPPEEGDPRIYRIDTKSKLHNINSKTGLPLAFRKNTDVESVTVFVGDETFEYNNLGDGEVAGIVIPARAFKRIGRYDIKMIPFSLDELEETRREITRRGVTREVVTEETKFVEVRVPRPVIIPRPPRPPLPPRVPTPPDIIVRPKPLPPKPPKPPRPPKPPFNPPKPPRVVPIPSGGGGRGSGVGSSEVIDFTERGRRIPSPYDGGGGFDNADGSRTRRIERLL